jgi:hypothetical protein
VAVLMSIAAGAASVGQAADRPIDFNRDIRPILSDTCFHCHGPDPETREAGLRLDVQAAILEDRGGFAAVVPGKPDASEMIVRITTDDEFTRMPPPDSEKHLTAEQAELIRRWIAEGAPWAEHWAYVPPRRVEPPQVKQTDWPRSPIDRFILARLEAADLPPAADADRVSLIRRLTFDLTGLPPTVADVSAFVNDQSPDAVKNLVDRLLASPAFGERMAVVWLDLVRFADTVGYHGDQDHNITPYRDWVIEAFNSNVPFDSFTAQQLAGDLLPDADIDTRIASGYNRLLQTTHEGGAQPKEYTAIYLADRVRNVSAVWMGATVGCAQCHDHKYDPYTIHDFYSLGSFFADVDEMDHFRVGTNALPTRRPPEIDVHTRRERERLERLDTEISELTKQLADLKVGEERTQKEKQLAALKAEKEKLSKAKRKTMVTVAIKPREVRVLPRGNWLDDSGPVVTPAVPEFMGHLKIEGRRANRLDLAKWLTDAEHGSGLLTARVMANRYWAMLFGEGLSRSLEDFGGQGTPPTHPELLDYLAISFVESGWDTKKLLRTMVLSRAYQQSSTVSPEVAARDPQNELFGRQTRFRLPAEMIRDNALAVSGLLVNEVGGASVKPYQPAGYYRHLNFPPRQYTNHTDVRQWRRGVYMHWQRQFLHPMLKAFDAPTREECTAKRSNSNTPLAALVLLNDPTFVEAARVFAERTLRTASADDDSRLEFIYQTALGRGPDGTEKQIVYELLNTQREKYRSDAASAEVLIATGLAPVAKDLDAAELASWTIVCRAVLNLTETTTRR